MRTYIIRRLLLMIPTVFIVSVIIFFLVRLIPGTIVDSMVAMQMVTGASVSEVQMPDREAIEHSLGLDVPIYTQYARWIGVFPDMDGNFSGIFQGDLGLSLWKGSPVSKDIATRWPISLELGVLGVMIAQLIALPIGVFSALRQDTWGDYVSRSFALFCIAVPGFWLGTMIIVFPSIWWGWAPPIILVPFTEDPIGNLKMFIIPAIVLGMVMSGTTMRMTRTMMLEVLRQDYIRTAWAKGLRERAVILRHALKNALIPVITIIGLQMPLIIGGTVIIEQIFCLPGMGRLLISAIQTRDYPIVSGLMLIFSIFLMLVNLAVDLSYAYLDPRIHYR